MVDWAAFFLLIPIALLFMAIPVNPPGALGTGEAIYSLLLELIAIGQGSMISLLHRAVNIVWALPGLLAFFAFSNKRDREAQGADGPGTLGSESG